MRRHKNNAVVPADLSRFYVVTIISNPVRYKRRYELYWKFAEMCECAGVKLITVEQAFGDRPFVITNRKNKYHLQVRSHEVLWLKENLINLGIKHVCHLDPMAREVAWIDADCRPMRTPRDWFEETWHELQHHEFVQMFEYMIDLDHNFNPMTEKQISFMASYVQNGFIAPNMPGAKRILSASGSKQYGRTGLAWAASIDAINKVGRVIDCAILGSGDWHMAHGLVGAIKVSAPKHLSSGYYKALLAWQILAERYIKRDVGYVTGGVYHDNHGHKADRRYASRWQVLINNEYDPFTDIKYDAQGLLQLETHEPRQIRLRDEIRQYFRVRNEDDIYP